MFTSPGPELIQLGPLTLRWYGLLIALAVLIGLNDDLSASAAAACVRAARSGSLRNPLQLWFLWSFARRWRSASKKSSKPPIPNPSYMFLSKRASDSYVRCLASNTS